MRFFHLAFPPHVKGEFEKQNRSFSKTGPKVEFFNLKRLAYRMKTKTNAMMSHIVHSMLCKRGFSTYFHRFGVFVYSGKWRKKNSVSKSIRKRVGNLPNNLKARRFTCH